MKQPIPEVVFISAYTSNDIDAENERQTNVLRMILKGFNVGFKETIGCYEGQEEQSFMVGINRETSLEKLLELAKEHFNQDFITYRNELKQTYLVFTDTNKKMEFIGITDTISSERAMELKNYTYFPSSKQYLGVTENYSKTA